MAANAGFSQYTARPRILVTRPLEVGDDLAFEESLRSAGLSILSIPLIEVVTGAFSAPDWTQYDWVFFTSKNAVKAIGTQLSFSQCLALSLACVGPATEQTLHAYGLQARFVSPVHDARSAVQYFAKSYALSGLRIFWPCGNLADPHLQIALEAQGALVTACPVYETHLKTYFTESEKQALADPVDLMVFTSPSAVEAFQQAALKSGSLSGFQSAIACLGPRTAQAAIKAFGRVDIQPDQFTLTALSRAICQYFESEEPS